MKNRVGIIGHGYVGSIMKKLFSNVIVFDEIKIDSKTDINQCEIANVCVPIPNVFGGKLRCHDC